tara:strand:+ start:1278 stop:1748 length:471 start_codon:yes stop_codon:yes gene_type:complete
MVEVGMAISLASQAFSAIKKSVEMGREVEDIAGYFGKFFDAKDQLAAASQYDKNQPMVKKLFAGSSVEAQALEITAARHKMAALEKELREYLLYTGQVGFYEDMMKERRNIRAARLREAARKAESKRLWTDIIALVLGGTLIAFVIAGTVSLIVSV